MWTPPLCTPPGHHDTLRVRRALVRISRNDTTNAVSTRNAVPEPAPRAPNGSTSKIALAGITASTVPRARAPVECAAAGQHTRQRATASSSQAIPVPGPRAAATIPDEMASGSARIGAA
jgi:hypothetical protein